MAAPDPGDAVLQRQLRVGVLGDIDDGEIVLDEGVGQAGESDGEQHGQRPGGWACQRHPGRCAAVGADQRQDALGQRNTERQDQREVSEFGDHCFTVLAVASMAAFWACASPTALAASGGM